MHVLAHHPRQHDGRIGIVQDVGFGGLVAAAPGNFPAFSMIIMLART